MTRDLVTIIVTALLSGGIFSALGALVASRATARKTSAEAKSIASKLPAEVDSVVVQGAESAVLTMKAALDSATERIAQLEREREADRKRIRELEAKVDQLRRKVEVAERSLSVARKAGDDLRRELEEFITEQGGRR